MKTWKTFEKFTYHSGPSCVSDLVDKKYKVSEWIKDIVLQPSFMFEIPNCPVKLVRIGVDSLGFTSATDLAAIYEEFFKQGFQCVPPSVAIASRFIYNEQPTGEWLRIATPLDAMIDSDGVPHLPKLGKALGAFFLETYWSYPNAVFHPHNEFVVVAP